jgi:hypothetical protein
MTDYKERAEECRKLAKMAVKSEDCGHFLEMAQTWELLAEQRQSDTQKLTETMALAEGIARQNIRSALIVGHQRLDSGKRRLSPTRPREIPQLAIHARD